MIELSEAQRFVWESVGLLAPVDCAIDETMGRVVAEEILAREAVPGFANSSMDGFALRSRDTASGSARLRVTDVIHAGDVAAGPLTSGSAARIMTGAPLPDGADSVCMVEEARVSGDFVEVPRVLREGEHVRRVGEDTWVGQSLFSPGDVMNAPGIGVLAGQGYHTVRVYPSPRVGVLSTGNELTSGGGLLGPGKIRDLNRPLLLALLAQSGFVGIDLGTAADTSEAVARSLREGVEGCDAVVSSGGVSVGDADFVKDVIGDMSGADARWMQVAIKPGKPFAFGVVGPRRIPIFGLPGNPVSTRVNFELFVRPALRKMAGHRRLLRATPEAVLDTAIERTRDGKLHLVHVNVSWGDEGRLHVEQTMARGSHLLNAITGANAIALVPEGVASGVGDVVRVMLLDADSLGDPR